MATWFTKPCGLACHLQQDILRVLDIMGLRFYGVEPLESTSISLY